jgi:hypothetical protein
MAEAKARLRRVAVQAQKGLLLKPALFEYMMTGKYPRKWQVVFRQPPDRAPDGFFHPSSAPMMGERQLYYFLTEPGRWEREPFDYPARMSTFIGSAVHDFVKMCLTELHFLIPPEGACIACGLNQPRQCDEHGMLDSELGARGHADGIMKDAIFELKTCAPLILLKVPDLDQEFFKERWPGYYYQVHDYGRMTGYQRARILIVGIGMPWEMREFVIEFEPDVMNEIAEKYRSVRRHEELGVPPQPCCAPSSAQARSCPATGCEIRRLSVR